MNFLVILETIMPILALIIILAVLIAVVLIIINGKTKRVQSTTISQRSFEKLAQELKADNEILKSELATIKETLNSINKMMKEI